MRLLSATALATVLLSGAASAQILPELSFPKFEASDFSVEYGVSTLGVYMAPSVNFSEKFAVRMPMYRYTLKDTFDLDDSDTDVEGEFSIESYGLVADYYFYKGFRVSGGVSFGGYNLTAGLTDPEFDGITYEGKVDISLEQEKDVAPVLALGYRGNFTKNFGVVVEAGARLTSLEVTYSNSTITKDLAEFDAEIAEINDDLQDLGILPFISVGVTYRF